jgi:hypothetical protein
MFTSLLGIGSAIVTGVSDYFKGKQEISKAKLEGDVKVLVAEAEARVRRLEKESEQDYDLDKLATQNMEKSWKDELILITFLAPVVMCFIPEYKVYVANGFASLALVPDWYMGILVGMVVIIYGMRGLLKMALQMGGNKFNLVEHVDTNKKDQL